jgi:hypothetical protein
VYIVKSGNMSLETAEALVEIGLLRKLREN